MNNLSLTKITNYLIYFYAFSMPFEQSVIPLIGITYGKLFGFMLMVLLIKYIRFERLISIYVPLFLLIAWFSVVDIIYAHTIHKMIGSLSQSVFLMMLIYNYLYNKAIVRERMFYSLMLSIGYVGLMVILGINVNYSDDGRLIYQDAGINALGFWAAMSIIVTLNLWKNKVRTKIIYVFIALIPFYFNMILQGASRGSLVVLILGVLGVYVLGNKDVNKKVTYSFISLVLVYVIWNIAMDSPVMSVRMNSLIESGDNTRTSVWEVVFPIFLDNPITGVSPSNYMDIIESFIGVRKDVHNAYLYILVTSGIIGGVIFFIFLVNIFRFVYKNAKRNNNYIFLILLFIQFFDWLKGGGSLYPKTTWFVITYILSGSLNFEFRSKINVLQLIQNILNKKQSNSKSI